MCVKLHKKCNAMLLCKSRPYVSIYSGQHEHYDGDDDILDFDGNDQVERVETDNEAA